VPENVSLKENEASNTFENAEFSYKVLQKHKIKVEKAILVCKTYHSRRSYLTYKINFPSTVTFYVSPVIDSRDIQKDNWYLDTNKSSRVMSEVMKIGKYFENYIPYLIDKDK
jgi:uncharacterized SAM-binding protein YcdF (DUF218 family)